jgi:sugar phosphate isomerase/epimerase
MADKKLTLIVDAKNQTDAGLKGVNASIGGLRQSMMRSLAGVTGTVAAVVAAFMLVKKAIEAVVEASRRARNAIMDIAKGNADAAVRSIGQAAEMASYWFDRATKKAKDFASVNREIRKSTDELADAFRAGARAQDAYMLAGLGGTSEELAALDERNKLEDKRIEAARKIAGIEQSMSDAGAEIEARNEQIKTETQLRQAAMAEMKKQRELAKKYGAERAEMMSGFLYSADEADKLKANEAAAVTAQENIAKSIADSIQRENALRDAQDVAEKKRVADGIALSAAIVESESAGIAEAAAQQAKNNDAILDQRKEIADLNAQMADELDKQVERNWKAEKEKHEQVLAMKEYEARIKVKDFVDLQKANDKARKADDRDAERDQRKADRLRARMGRGERIGGGQERWLEGFDAIKAAQAGIGVANQNLEDIRKEQDSRNLELIKQALDKNLVELGKKIRLG